MRSILERVAAGDERAVTECVDAYGGLVWRLARRYLDRADLEVEDAVQEVFVEIWMVAGRFDPALGSEPGFIATIAHRRLTDVQRRVTSRRRRQLAAIDGAASATIPASVHASDEVQRAVSTFNGLPDDERRVLWMAVKQGLTHHQISDATDTPIGTVKTRLRRAMGRMCNAMADDDGDKSTAAKGERP